MPEALLSRTIIALAFLLPFPADGATRKGDITDPEAASLYERATRLELTQSFAEAADLYRRAAERGHAASHVRLGYLHERGRGVDRDPAFAVTLYRESAESGDPLGQHLLGLALLGGLTGANDPSEARRWFAVAANSGHQPSQLLLGLMLLEGKGGPRNQIAAGRWFDRASTGPEPNLAVRAAALRHDIETRANTRDELSPGALLAGVVAIWLLGAIGDATHEAQTPQASPALLEESIAFNQCLLQQTGKMSDLDAAILCAWLR